MCRIHHKSHFASLWEKLPQSNFNILMIILRLIRKKCAMYTVNAADSNVRKYRSSESMYALLCAVFVHCIGCCYVQYEPAVDHTNHGLRTHREEIAFTARPKIQSQSQIFRYGRSTFCLPHWPKFSDTFDLCLHWVSVVRGNKNLDNLFLGKN